MIANIPSEPRSPSPLKPYRFTTIADTTDFASFEFPFLGVPLPTAPAINTAGQVVFLGSDRAARPGIYVGQGAGLTQIADTSGQFNILGAGPSINDAGQVAFLGGLDTGDAGYFTSTHSNITSIANSTGPYNFLRTPTLDNLFGEPALNNKGTVVFRADLDKGGRGIFTVQGNHTRTIVNSQTSLLQTFCITPDINESDTVVFAAGFTPVPGTIAIAGQTVPIAELFHNAGVFTGSGGQLTAIATVGRAGLILFGSTPAINDAGQVAFIGISILGEFGIYTGTGGFLTEVVDSSGAFSSFRSVDLNDAGKVAYLADFDTGGSGIFVDRQAVIRTGDSLLGSTVVDLNFFNKGFNDQGSIAFYAKLADGRSGVFRADAQPTEGSANRLSNSPISLGTHESIEPVKLLTQAVHPFIAGSDSFHLA